MLKSSFSVLCMVQFISSNVVSFHVRNYSCSLQYLVYELLLSQLLGGNVCKMNGWLATSYDQHLMCNFGHLISQLTSVVIGIGLLLLCFMDC